MRVFFLKVWGFIKKKAWYLILLCTSSFYIWSYRAEIYQLKELNTQNLVFFLWLLLLLLPLFSEMEFLGIKVKKEVEKATEEVKDSIHILQKQVSQLQMSNTVENNISFGNTPLPSEQKVEELLQLVQELKSTYPKTSAPVTDSMNIEGDKNIFLFKVRLDIETSLRELMEKIGYTDKIFLPMNKMIHILSSAEVIDGMTCDIISQVTKIANRGVHGEIVSDEYVTLVKETYPEIMRQLKVASSQLHYITCQKCRYSGYSKYENVCPQCNYTFDGD